MAELLVGRDRVEALEEKNDPAGFRSLGVHPPLFGSGALSVQLLALSAPAGRHVHHYPLANLQPPFSGESLSGLVSGLSLCASSAAPIESVD